MDKPFFKIYVSCLASYSCGTLYGSWINVNACDTLEDLEKAVQDMIKGSPTKGAEEYAIHGTDTLLTCIEEYTPLKDVFAMKELMEAYPETAVHLLNHYCSDLPYVTQLLEDSSYEYGTKDDFIDEYAVNSLGIPENALDYVNRDTVWNTITTTSTAIFTHTEYIEGTFNSLDWYILC